ncbi:MAG: Rpn family recombination-promoting nuclease/putative transposase, partial [Rhodospirillales bacterium]|nr:Rpn family recombination-promoting nuclease/putative transposase [Rhodospirillales bacterium]
MTGHDSFYRQLFSRPEMVEQLLRDFVDEPWVAEGDFTALERVNATFSAAAGQRRESDMVWRLPLRDGGEVYLYLLMEFQSVPERWMALRVLVYVGLLWQQLVEEGRLAPGNLLPPVFPLVLYNGDRRWRAPVSLTELIALPADAAVWPWQPRARYHLLDEGRYSAEDLKTRPGLPALVFRMETWREIEEILPLTQDLIAWFRGHPGYAALRPLVLGLLTRVGQDDQGEPVAIPEDLREVMPMMETRVERMRQKLIEQGRQQGQQQGRQEGR